MVKKIALLSIVLMVCFAFAGCTGLSSKTDNADSSSIDNSQVNVPPVPPDPIQE